MLRNIHEEIRIISRAVIFIHVLLRLFYTLSHVCLILLSIVVVFYKYFFVVAERNIFATFHLLSLALCGAWMVAVKRSHVYVKILLATPIICIYNCRCYFYKYIYMSVCIYNHLSTLWRCRVEIMIFSRQKGLNFAFKAVTRLWVSLYIRVVQNTYEFFKLRFA